jgi:hypothetical protein
MTEEALGWRYLSDPAVPLQLAAAVRDAGFIPLEPLNPAISSTWWCRCSRCGEVIAVTPEGHGYQGPGRSPYHVHDFCEAGRQTPGEDLVASIEEWLRSRDDRL